MRTINLIKVTVILGLLGCASPQPKEKPRYMTIAEILEQNLDSSYKGAGITYVVNQIAIYPTVDGGSVGIGGIQSEQYRRFLWLKDFATNQELVDLTRSSSVNVRIYSFKILHDRGDPVCKQILDRLVDDTASFTNFSGCIQLTDYANMYCLRISKDMLSAKEYSSYKQRISKNFSEKEWRFLNSMN